ncbi:hypothetical protein DJ84_06990, partial [Halorubrum ezzemoulense]
DDVEQVDENEDTGYSEATFGGSGSYRSSTPDSGPSPSADPGSGGEAPTGTHSTPSAEGRSPDPAGDRRKDATVGDPDPDPDGRGDSDPIFGGADGEAGWADTDATEDTGESGDDEDDEDDDEDLWGDARRSDF